MAFGVSWEVIGVSWEIIEKLENEGVMKVIGER
jgi:hypothetical protein